jgi:hypothetical protein
MAQIAIPINSEIIGELFLRKGPKTDLSSWIENIIEDYIDRTADDSGWSEEYYDYLSEQNVSDEFGDPNDGYHWNPLFLPNGTSIYMIYKGEKSLAKVKFGKIHFNDETYSPSEFARTIAQGTSRNAWRDLYIKRPKDTEYALAYSLRILTKRGGL